MTHTPRWRALAFALFAVSGLLIGSSFSALKWRSDNAVWRARALSAEGSLADAKEALKGASGELDELRAESAELRERVDELANEKAGVQDDVAMADLERAAYERLAKRYAATIELWRECVNGHEQWLSVLANKNSYKQSELKRYYSDLEAVCNEAEEEDNSLRSQLSP